MLLEGAIRGTINKQDIPKSLCKLEICSFKASFTSSIYSSKLSQGVKILLFLNRNGCLGTKKYVVI